MTTPPPGSGPNVPPEDQPGWGAPPPPPPGYGQAPGYGQQPAYGQQPGYGQGYPAAPGYSAPGAAAPQLDIATAVRSVLSQYANFTGRARRSEFWWFYLANFLASIVASIIDQIIGVPLFQVVVALGLLIPGLAVGARRLHDIGKSGWWQLIALVPLVGIILLIVWWATDSDPAPNQHGPSPKYQAAGGPGY